MSESFKQAVKTKEEVLLLNCPIDITRSQLEVALGHGDYDAVYFDGQHRPISDDKIVAFCEKTEALPQAGSTGSALRTRQNGKGKCPSPER